MKVFAVLLLAVAVAAAADYGRPTYKPVYKTDDYKESYPSASYDFKWDSTAENPDTVYGQRESRKGDNTKGDFDSTNSQTSSKVVYTVDGDSGFVAQSQFDIKGDSYVKPAYPAPPSYPSYPTYKPKY